MIFDEIQRTDTSPKRNLESSFEFLNRSARPEISRVRDFVKLCATGYPSPDVDELIARLRSGNDTNFDSAMFELLLYAALTRLGFELEPHPQLENGSTARPDFLVTTPEGELFYLEAVLASEIREWNQGGGAIKGAVMDALASTNHPNFMIDIFDEGRPTTQPSGKKLANEILEWLDTLDPDQVQEIIKTDSFDAVPNYTWKHEGWLLTFRPIPLNADRRGKVTTLVGMGMGSVGAIDAWSPIRDAVKSKGRKYGTLNLPFLVAVNVDTFALHRIDEMQALYGQEQLVFAAGHPEQEPRLERAPNGAWHGPHGPQYTRVSGAWFFNALSPYTVASRRNTIYLNPWATAALPENLLALPHAKADEAQMNWVDGKSFREIFGLHEGWPE